MADWLIRQALHVLMLFAACVQAQGIDREYSRDRGALARLIDGGTGRSYALLIGISQYIDIANDGFASLATTKDVERMRTFLLDTSAFDAVHVLSEERATKARIEELMVDTFPGRVRRNDRFVFYWSGHGIAREVGGGNVVGYLPLRNSRRQQYHGMVSMDDIERWNRLLSAHQALFIIDACMSGLAGTQTKSDARSLSLDQLAKPARHLFVAGTATELSIVGDRWNGSLFTHAFIRGASGDAAPSAAVISLSHILSYVRDHVASEASRAGWRRTLSPQLRQLVQSDGEFFFLRAGAPRQLLEFAPGAGGAVGGTKGTDYADPGGISSRRINALPPIEDRADPGAVGNPTGFPSGRQMSACQCPQGWAKPPDSAPEPRCQSGAVRLTYDCTGGTGMCSAGGSPFAYVCQ